MKIGQVYCITYLEDGRKYFGFSVRAKNNGYEKRFEKHMSGSGSRHIKNLINNGAKREQFKIELIFEGSVSEALQKEEEFSKLTLFPAGLNGNCGLWANTKGYKFVNNGEHTKSVAPEEIDLYINLGWNYGRVLTDDQRNRIRNGAKKSKGKKYLNKDGVNVMASEGEIQKRIEEGWSLGKFVTDEYRESLSKNGKTWNKNSIDKNPRAKGYVWLNDGKKDIRVNKEKAVEFLSNGFSRGRLWSKSKKSISSDNILC